jgi:hypothetical protein
MGKTLIVHDSLVRACFEFLPLPWLRNYRKLKSWIFSPPPALVSAEPASLGQPQEAKALATEIVGE